MFERSTPSSRWPGGIGTLEELVEQLTWQQLGRHSKPVLLANIDNFWEPLLALLAQMRRPSSSARRCRLEVLQAETGRRHLAAPARRRRPCGRGDQGTCTGRGKIGFRA